MNTDCFLRLDRARYLQNTGSGGSGSSATASSGNRRIVRVMPPPIKVTEIYFQSGIDVWYACYPETDTYLWYPALAPNASRIINPIKILPAANAPHYKKSYGSATAEHSWPAVYVRSGTTVSPAPTRALKVSFQAPNNFNATVKIQAVSSTGVLVTEKSVTFSNGVAANIDFTFDGIPNKIRRLNGIQLAWKVQTASGGTFDEFDRTYHTLFIIDWQSAAARTATRGGENKFLFEVYDWACRWADNVSGHNTVLNAIWSHFSPVRNRHESGLVYWKNHDATPRVSPAQNLVSAIQSHYVPDVRVQDAASCIVFDLVLMNCLAVHGIKAGEIEIQPANRAFTKSGIQYFCESFNGKGTFGQGNPNGPESWSNHWIADVVDSARNWKIYDPSYGVGPADSNAPTGTEVNVLNYEPLGVRSFACTYDIGAGEREGNIPPGLNAATPPHIKGIVRSRN